jgi:hypothetical protein
MHLHSRWRLSNNGNCFPISCGDVSAFAMASSDMFLEQSFSSLPISINSILKAHFTMTKMVPFKIIS